jgi:long-chain acyl-CoA synthetase
LRYIVRLVEPRAIFTVKPPSDAVISTESIEDLSNDGAALHASATDFPGSADIADVLFTTGTTGDPKGVVLTHHNVRCAAENINRFIQNTADDREVVPLPLSHSFGLGRLRSNLLAGGTIILIDGFTFPAKIFQAIEHWNATGIATVPAGFTVLSRLTRNKIGQYARQLKYIEIGSAPMPIEQKRRLMELLPNTHICMHYGLTEASRSTFIEFHESAEKLISIGRPTPNVEVKILDPGGRECPPMESGQIVVKGGMVMKEYWRNPQQSAQALVAGWLRTGDYGYRDEEGYVFLQARESELINVGGRKVSPIEVERLLEARGDIDSCACVGIADPKGITGEAVKAFLVAAAGPQQKRPDDSELTEYLRDKLEPYKVPVAYEWIESLPMTASGKLQRQQLKTRISVRMPPSE